MNILLYDDAHEPVTASILNSMTLCRRFVPLHLRELLQHGSLVKREPASGPVITLDHPKGCWDFRSVSLLVNRLKTETIKAILLENGNLSSYKVLHGLLAQALAECRLLTSALSPLGFGIDPLPLIEQWRLVSDLQLEVPEYYYGSLANLPFRDVGVTAADPSDILAVVQREGTANLARKPKKEQLYFRKPEGQICSILVINGHTLPLSEVVIPGMDLTLHQAALSIAQSFGQRIAEVVFCLAEGRLIFLFCTADLNLLGNRPWIVELIQQELELRGLEYAV